MSEKEDRKLGKEEKYLKRQRTVKLRPRRVLMKEK